MVLTIVKQIQGKRSAMALITTLRLLLRYMATRGPTLPRQLFRKSRRSVQKKWALNRPANYLKIQRRKASQPSIWNQCQRRPLIVSIHESGNAVVSHLTSCRLRKGTILTAKGIFRYAPQTSWQNKRIQTTLRLKCEISEFMEVTFAEICYRLSLTKTPDRRIIDISHNRHHLWVRCRAYRHSPQSHPSSRTVRSMINPNKKLLLSRALEAPCLWTMDSHPISTLAATKRVNNSKYLIIPVISTSSTTAN